MSRVLNLFSVLILLSGILVADSMEQICKESISNYFKIFEKRDFSKFKSIFDPKAKKLLKTHLIISKLSNQKLLNWEIKKVITSDNMDIYLVKSSWRVYKANSSDSFDSNLKTAFILKKDAKSCKILNIYPSDVYDLIIKGYFFKRLLSKDAQKDINETANLIKKMKKLKYKREYTPPKVISKYAIANIYLHHQKAAEEWFKEWTVIKMPIEKDGKPKIISDTNRFGWYPKITYAPRGVAPPQKPNGSILYMHPVSPKEPAILRRVLRVNPRQNMLYIRASSAFEVDWELIVRVNGKKIFDEIVKDFRWKDFNISLREYEGKLAKVDVEIASNNWWNEFAYIDEIRIGSQDFIDTQDMLDDKIKKGYDNSGEDYRFFRAKSYQECIKACNEDSRCRAWSLTETNVKGRSSRCWLKSSVGEFKELKGAISGLKK